MAEKACSKGFLTSNQAEDELTPGVSGTGSQEVSHWVGGEQHPRGQPALPKENNANKVPDNDRAIGESHALLRQIFGTLFPKHLHEY